MAKEIVDLRAAVLKMRAQILKLACSLNSVGAEAGKILHSRGSTDSQSSGADYGHCPSAMRDSTGDSSSPAEFDYGDVSEEPVGFDELHPALTHGEYPLSWERLTHCSNDLTIARNTPQRLFRDQQSPGFRPRIVWRAVRGTLVPIPELQCCRGLGGTTPCGRTQLRRHGY